MAAAVTARWRYEMALERAEFLRLLPAAVAPGAPAERDGALTGTSGPVTWRIVADALPPRRIARLVLPALDVAIDAQAPAADDLDTFHARFRLAFQRAGG